MTEHTLPDHAQVEVPRSAWQLVWDGKFGGFFWTRLATSLALWAYNIVGAVMIYQMTGSATMVGLMAGAQAAPQFLFGPFMGGVTDRGNPALLVTLGFTASGLGMVGLGATALALPLDGTAGGLVVLASSFGAGVGFLISGPAMMALVTVMVRPDEIGAAMALNTVPVTLSRAVGPALGGIGAALWEPGVVVLAAGIINLVAAILVLLLHLPSRLASEEELADAPTGGSWSLFRERAQVRLILLGVTAVGFGADTATTLAPALAEAVGRPSEWAGMMTSAFGVGAVASLPALGLLRRRLGLAGGATLGLVAMAVGIGVVALASGQDWLVLVGFFIAGLGMSVAFTKTTTLIQLAVPVSARGRVMGLWMIAFVGSRPLGSALSGAVTDLTNVQIALGVMTALICAMTWSSRPAAVDPRRELG